MERSVNIKIDGKPFEVESGLTILEAARLGGIDIPTLCFDEALKPYAACRLCVVEVTQRGGKRYSSACTHPVEEGIEVATATPEILAHRKMLIELYLARSPKARKIRELAEKLGVCEPRYTCPETHNCILCGLCVRACAEIVGASAIGFSQRGMKRKVEPPFGRGSAACISCGTCTTICPTEAITIEEVDQVKSIHTIRETVAATVPETIDAQAGMQTCRICAAFDVVPEVPKSYREWLGEKFAAKPLK